MSARHRLLNALGRITACRRRMTMTLFDTFYPNAYADTGRRAPTHLNREGVGYARLSGAMTEMSQLRMMASRAWVSDNQKIRDFIDHV